MSRFPEAAFWLALAYASDLKLARVKNIVAAWCLEGGWPLAALFDSSPERIAARLGLSAEDVEGVVAAAKRVPEQATWLAQLESDGVQLLSRSDWRYPPALVRWLPLNVQPLLLFGRGDVGLLGQPSVAVMGARGASRETMGLVRELAALIAEEGLVLVSGLGKGVGQAAFGAALSAEGGRAVAVLPMGINAFAGLPDAPGEGAAAVERGQALLLSPFHPEAKFSEAQAIARNRLIAALAEALFVLAAGEQGLTRETADEALRMGKAVYVWDVDPNFEPAAAGNQALIRAGALPIAGLPDILDALEAVVATALELMEAMEKPPTPPPPLVNQVQEAEEPYDPQAVLDLLSGAGRVPEALARRLRGDEKS